MKGIFKSARALVAVLLLAGTASLQSCLNDDDNDYYYMRWPNALVTVKPTSADAFTCSWTTIPH